MEISVEKKISEERKKKLGAENWPLWSCPAETFDWEYDENETCIILEGKVRIKHEENKETEFEAGDLVFFPKGLKCTWIVEKPVRKLYKFG